MTAVVTTPVGRRPASRTSRRSVAQAITTLTAELVDAREQMGLTQHDTSRSWWAGRIETLVDAIAVLESCRPAAVAPVTTPREDAEFRRLVSPALLHAGSDPHPDVLVAHLTSEITTTHAGLRDAAPGSLRRAALSHRLRALEADRLVARRYDAIARRFTTSAPQQPPDDDAP